MRKNFMFLFLIGVPALLLGVSCKEHPTQSACAGRGLRLATTTSVEQTGLLQVLVPPFEQKTGIAVQVLAVGSGQALKLLQNGDVDAVLAHDRQAEERAVQDGYAVNRRALMHNDFVLVGPDSDPAGIGGGQDAVLAFGQIAQQKVPFVSRGDESGTHHAEMDFWKRAGVEPAAAWRQETGQGQMQTLLVASEKQAYCLTDRATFQSAQSKLKLRILVEGDTQLYNSYAIMASNPGRFHSARYLEAMTWIGWLTSYEGQTLIGEFRIQGRAAFIPDALSLP